MLRMRWTRVPHVLRVLGWVSVCVACCSSQVPPACPSRVYCRGPILHAVQTGGLYDDSKTFVDFKMLKSENDTLSDYDEFIRNNGNKPTRAELQTFVREHFEEGDELMNWTLPDYQSEPELLNRIKDPVFRQFAKNIIEIWPSLARKVDPKVVENPDRYSLMSLPNGFIIPGGRFKEIYYWDSFWIIEGIILSGMTDTARGMIDNLLHLVKSLGHVPNGSRVYYTERSQPPLLTAMAAKYVGATKDLAWLEQNIKMLETELEYWMNNKTVEVAANGRTFTMLRYNAPSAGPRPESYAEDFLHANDMGSEEQRQEFYTDIKSAAESGWDFSARWFTNNNSSEIANLSDISTRRVIPVDLNAIYAAALQTMGDLNNLISKRRAAIAWWELARDWRRAIDKVLWNDEDGTWYDYDLQLQASRKHFYPSNVSPLWMRCVEPHKLKEYGPKVVRYLKESQSLTYPGGIPTSLDHTGEQWDYPNAWPPLQSMLIQALVATETREGRELAKELAERWVRANLRGYTKYREMFEKYDAELPGEYGGGGEYVVQNGFGWTNGVVLELLNLFGDVLRSSSESPERPAW